MKLHDAYERELKLLPIIIEMEQHGIPLDRNIVNFTAEWQNKFDKGEAILKERANGAKPGSKAMFNAFRELGYIDESKITYTDKGNPKYGREFIDKIVTDKILIDILKRRSKLQKILGTYLNPWAKSFIEHNGKFYPWFNQTRGDNDYGTRTGRMSSNLQQIPRNPDPNDDLPNLRKMIVPEKDHVILKRDFNAQEIRVAAHFAEGSIMRAYNENANLDVHNFVKELILNSSGADIDRNIVKAINFLKLYGGGVTTLSEKLNISIDRARQFFNAYDAALPEFKQLVIEAENQVKSGVPIRTWGGRLYDVEPAKIIDGKLRSFYYKLSNILIQGSSADQTKEAVIRFHYHADRHPDCRVLLIIHDEIVLTCPADHAKSQMQILKWAMEDMEGWDVPMRSDGKIGSSFGDLEDFNV